jgi:DNA replication and repair protein RecF
MWAVSASINNPGGEVEVGTGLELKPSVHARPGRVVKINAKSGYSSGALAEHLQMIWLTPARDGLFTGPASERRNFLDELIFGLAPGYRRHLKNFERAMRQRNRLLEDGLRDDVAFRGLETMMAEEGCAIAAARVSAVEMLSAAIYDKFSSGDDEQPFPWSSVSVSGEMEEGLRHLAAVEVEDQYQQSLQNNRDRDRAARRTLVGPHRSDLDVTHGPKQMAARLCSTGEQKALLVGIVMAYCELLAQVNNGNTPLLLLDEVAAHLDEYRREALFAEIINLKAQAWMTGTDRGVFSSLAPHARMVSVA